MEQDEYERLIELVLLAAERTADTPPALSIEYDGASLPEPVGGRWRASVTGFSSSVGGNTIKGALWALLGKLHDAILSRGHADLAVAQAIEAAKMSVAEAERELERGLGRIADTCDGAPEMDRIKPPPISFFAIPAGLARDGSGGKK